MMKGLCIGVMAGMVAGMMGMCYMQHNRRGIKRNVGRALRNMGNLVDNVTGMF